MLCSRISLLPDLLILLYNRDRITGPDPAISHLPRKSMDSFILQQDKMPPETNGDLQETIVLPSNRQGWNREASVFPQSFSWIYVELESPEKWEHEVGIAAYASNNSTQESEARGWQAWGKAGPHRKILSQHWGTVFFHRCPLARLFHKLVDKSFIWPQCTLSQKLHSVKALDPPSSSLHAALV